MLTVNDSPSSGALASDPAALTWAKVGALVDRLWPHLAAWGLAALVAFFAVKERLSLMEVNANTVLERVKRLEVRHEDQADELRGISTNTAEIRAMLEGLVKEADERRGEERRAYRERMERGQR